MPNDKELVMAGEDFGNSYAIHLGWCDFIINSVEDLGVLVDSARLLEKRVNQVAKSSFYLLHVAPKPILWGSYQHSHANPFYGNLTMATVTCCM